MKSTFVMMNSICAIKVIMRDIWDKGYRITDNNGNFNELWNILNDRTEKDNYEGYEDIAEKINGFKITLKGIDDLIGKKVNFDNIIYEDHNNIEKSWIGFENND
jgi:hypothetical protein